MAVGIKNWMFGWRLVAWGVEEILIEYKVGRGRFANKGYTPTV